jgi:hypothetical protein
VSVEHASISHRQTTVKENYISRANATLDRRALEFGECCVESNELKKATIMDEALKAKLDEAREQMNSQQAGINANRKHDDPAMREWARGKQRPANAERAQFRNSLTDEERSQIEERIEQLVHDNPTLSPKNARPLDSKAEPPSVSAEVLDEYYFLRDILD